MRTLWITTTILATVATIVGAYRLYAPSPSSAAVTRMLSLVDVDPRLRLEDTQAAVTAVAEAVLAGAWHSPEALYGAGLYLHYLQKHPAKAEAYYHDAIAARPDWSWPHNSLAVLLHTEGRKAEAEAAFREAMRLDPLWSRPHSDLAILYRLEGRVDDAEKEARRALELAPDNAATNNNYGVILDMLGDEAGAEAHYRRAITVAPDIPSPYYNVASLHIRRGDVDGAVAWLAKAIELDSGFRNELAADPDFAAVMDDPRVQALLTPEVPDRP